MSVGERGMTRSVFPPDPPTADECEARAHEADLRVDGECAPLADSRHELDRDTACDTEARASRRRDARGIAS